MVGGFGHTVVNFLFLNVLTSDRKRGSQFLLVLLKTRVGRTSQSLELKLHKLPLESSSSVSEPLEYLHLSETCLYFGLQVGSLCWEQLPCLVLCEVSESHNLGCGGHCSFNKLLLCMMELGGVCLGIPL